MNAPKLHAVRTREQSIELALDALMWAMCEESLPRKLRREIALVHADLQKYRSPETVARLERRQGLR
jgi:hypothetical protein